MKSELQELGGPPGGLLRVTTPGPLGRCPIAPLVEAHFHAEWRFGRGDDARAERIEVALVSSNSELPISWALAGAGLTQKSWWEVAPHIATGRLRTVLDAFEPDPVSFYAVHPLRSVQSRKVALFIEALRTCFEGFGR